MQTLGYQADSAGVRALYGDLVDCFIQDISDTTPVEDSYRYDTLMKSPEVAENLMREILPLMSGK